LAAQTSVVAWPKVRILVATLVAVSMSGAVKISHSRTVRARHNSPSR
jgi:hypothetical protein